MVNDNTEGSFNIIETDKTKQFIGTDYRYYFNKENGFFMRMGATEDDDPDWSPYGCEIADIEISTICSNSKCKFCYKSNTSKGENMSLDTFKMVFSKLPQTLTQIAFGIGDIDANPDLESIMAYTRENGIIPNITINGERMTPEYYDMLVRHCGAVAVSMYSYDECVTALKELRQRGLTQTNIHMVAAEESYRDCVALLKRLNQTGDKQHVNAVVFLCLKPVGRGQNKTPMSKAHFNELVELSFDFGINIGFDSCSAPLVYDCYPAPMQQMIEPCESGCFSVYVNVRGEVFPCSFTEQSAAYEGIPITDDTDFLDDIWFSETFNTFRNTLLDNKDCNGCRRCPAFNLYGDEVN